MPLVAVGGGMKLSRQELVAGLMKLTTGAGGSGGRLDETHDVLVWIDIVILTLLQCCMQ